MKLRRRGKKVLAVVMAMLMVVGLIPAGMFASEAKAEEKVYTFDASTLTAGTDKDAVTSINNDYFAVAGTVTQRVKDGAVYAIEVGKQHTGAFTFTVSDNSTANAVFKLQSTSSTNVSKITLVKVNADGTYGDVVTKGITTALTDVTITDGVISYTGATGDVTYTGLEAGDYALVSEKDFSDRGFRVYAATVTETVAAAEVTTTEYKFDAATLVAGTDKDAVTSINNDYFAVAGTVTQRVKDGAVYAIEIGKQHTGAFTFTVSDNSTADVVFKLQSTSSTNVSKITLVKVNADGTYGDVVTKGVTTALTDVTITDGVISYTGATGDVTYTGLEAGDYALVSEKDFSDRGFRVYAATVTETVVPVTTTEYKFDAATLIAGTDKDAVTSIDNKYFAVEGTVTQRVKDGAVYAIEIGKQHTGAFTFTVAANGTADAVFKLQSTSSTNVSKITLVKVNADGTYGDVVTKGVTTTLTDVTITDGVISYTGATGDVTYTGLEAGDYALVSEKDFSDRGFRVYAATVTETVGSAGEVEIPKTPWADVAAPVLGTPALKADDNQVIVIPFTMVIDDIKGADYVTVIVKDAAGEVLKEIKSSKAGESGSVEFSPSASGDYTFSIKASREGETDKEGAATAEFKGFAAKLGKTSISSVTGDGKNSVAVVWTAVDEADKYVVYYKEATATEYTKAGETAETKYTVSGLTAGKKYTIKVEVVRTAPAATTETTIDKNFTSEVERVWSTAAVGTQAASNAEKGSVTVNDDGSVTMYASDGKLASSNDGFLFYYTKVKSDSENFVFSAKVKIDKFEGDNQSGIGLLVADTIGEDGKYDLAAAINYYLAGLSKTEWKNEDGSKPGYACGPGFRRVTGCTDPTGVSATGRVLDQGNPFDKELTVDVTESGKVVSTGEVLTKDAFNAGTAITEYTFTLTKDNNGYHATMAGADGVVISSFDPSKLLQQDKEYVYVGLAVSRKVQATFSDIKFESRNPADDPAKDESTWDKELTPEELFVYAGDSTSQDDYNYRYYGSWDANVTLKDGTGKVLFSKDVAAYETISYDMSLTSTTTKLITTVTPDKEKVVAESYEPRVFETTVTKKQYGKEGDTIYVSPTGSPKGNGTEAKPLDIYTAVAYAQPGQVIVLKDGTYDLVKNVTIPFSVSGTADKMITLMAENTGKAKLDGTNSTATDSNGMIQINGDYWHLYGLEICNSSKTNKGIQISGNNNIVEMCDIHDNGTTGLQISRFRGEPKQWWPKNNLVKNCDSYNNCDVAFNDADGFAAKLTVGEGNKFYGCVAYNNIDDGWDLYAKNQAGQGEIAPVIIENCVAYNNGWLPGVGQIGEGNGFKLGGEGLPGAHQLINSIAFNNGAKGIASNNGPDCQVINCTSFNNSTFYNDGLKDSGAANIALSPLNGSSYAGSTNYVLKNTISMTTLAKAIKDDIKLVKQESIDSADAYIVREVDGALVSANVKGDVATTAWFKSVDTTKVPTRNANGTIDMHGVLELVDDKKAAGIGADLVTTGDVAISVQPQITTPTDGAVTGDATNAMPYVLLMLVAGMMLVAGTVVYNKKRA